MAQEVTRRRTRVGKKHYTPAGVSGLEELLKREPILLSALEELTGQSVDDFPSDDPTPEERAHQASIERLVEHLLTHVIQDAADCLIWRLIFGVGVPASLTYDGAALHLGLTRGRVNYAMKRGLKKLRVHFETNGFTPDDI